MRIDAPAPISLHRLARLFRWAGLWLMWAAWFVRDVLDGGCDHATARAILEMRQRMLEFVLLSADHRVRAHLRVRGPGGAPRQLKRGSALRAVTAELRRALTGKTPQETLARLVRAAADPEPCIAACARRLLLGFTRRLRLPRATQGAPLGEFHFGQAIAAADSS